MYFPVVKENQVPGELFGHYLRSDSGGDYCFKRL